MMLKVQSIVSSVKQLWVETSVFDLDVIVGDQAWVRPNGEVCYARPNGEVCYDCHRQVSNSGVTNLNVCTAGNWFQVNRVKFIHPLQWGLIIWLSLGESVICVKGKIFPCFVFWECSCSQQIIHQRSDFVSYQFIPLFQK